MSTRELTTQLQLRAQSELNEVPKRLQEDIRVIKEWIDKQTCLTARTEDQWILSFLRGCKFSLERTKDKLISYYSMRVIESSFFADRNPFSPEMQHILKAGFCLPLTKLADPSAPRVLLLQVGDDQKLSLISMIRITFMVLDILINEDDNFVIAGHIVIQDFKNVNLQHLVELTPTRTKNLMNCLQHAYPTRPKQFHFVNTPNFFPTLYGLVKHFMTDKIKSRINIYKNNNLSDLYKTIPKSILPTEYGGDAGPIQNLIDHWKRKVEDYKEWFLADQRYNCTILQLQDDCVLQNEGVMGSFRKLDID